MPVAIEQFKKTSVAWVTRSFLDYRVPVFVELDRLLEGHFHIFYSREFTPKRSWQKLETIIGNRAIGLTGEWSIGYKGNITEEMANTYLRFPCQPNLLKKIRDMKPDILIGDGFFQWTWHAFAYRLLTGTPLVICYERTKHTERHAQWFRSLFRKCMILFVGAMSVNGRLCREYVKSLGMSSMKITTGHMVADTATLSNRIAFLKTFEIRELKASLNIKQTSTVFLSVCRLVKLKGLDYLLLGWKHFQTKNRKDCVLFIVGTGPEKSRLQQLCRDKQIAGIHFAGAVDYDSIHKYYAAADVFVMPSLEDNWSLVVPEAMACGLPVLCSKYNGCWPELVHDDVNGWVFDPLDLKDIVRCLDKCISHKTNLKKMGPESIKIVAGHTPLHAAKAILRACEIAIQHFKS